MTFDFSGMVLDIAIAVILILSFIRGYKKGIVECVLHFASSLLILGIAWFLSKPAAAFFTFDSIEGIDRSLLLLISPVIGRVVGFVVIFVILSIIRIIIFMLLHSVIDGIKEHISVVRWVDNGFGAVFNTAKNTLFIYVILVGMCMPIFNNGMAVINDSKIGPLIMNVSPTISRQIITFGQEIADFIHVDDWTSQDFDMEDMIVLCDAMVSMDVLHDGQLDELYVQYQSQIDMIPTASVSDEKYQELMETIERLPASEPFKTVARSKIVRLG